MTQFATSQVRTPKPPPPRVRASAAPQPSGDPAHVDTPALLNRWQLIGMSVAIVFALLSGLVQFLGWQADGRAADDTEQLVRVQEIKSSLLRADALATNAFLVGGLEDPDQRAEYDDAIASVLAEITDAAQAQPADRDVLGLLNVDVTDYATAVAQARAANRQGFPIGAEYLSGASTALRADAIPVLDALIKANTERAESSMNGQHPFWLLGLGVLALGGLVWINQSLARHFRRRINKGVAVAATIVLGVTLVSVVGAWARDSSNDGLRDGELAIATAEASARTAANDAKANESLRLIKRGSAATYEDPWKASAAIVEESASRDTLGTWRAYEAVHDQIVELDGRGDWEKAVELATTRKEGAGGSTDALDAFDKAAKELVAQQGAVVTDDLRSGRNLAIGFSALTLLLGLIAAVSVARGIGERRREFQ